MKKKHQRRSKRSRKTKPLPFKKPNTAKQYFLLSSRDQETWDSVAHVIARIKDGVSLRRASKEFAITPSTVVQLGRPSVRKRKGRYVATKTDSLLRIITILGTKGKKVIATRDSRQASMVGSHWAAVQKYLQIGDDSALLKFNKKSVIDASGRRHRLLTNLKELDRLGSFGVLRFESMYAGGAR